MEYAVILAGGSGERFWPASTPERPKQLLPLLSDRTMLRETCDRLEGVVPPDRRVIVTSQSLVPAVAQECPEVPAYQIIGEPEGKNTAPAIGLAAGLLARNDPDAVLIAMPADHAIARDEAFREGVKSAFEIAAERDVLVLFGIVPNRPETGFGYVERGAPVEGDAFAVKRFVEKPNAEAAADLWRSGPHYWNSGLFCGRARVFLGEYEQHLPLMRKAIQAAVDGWDSDREGALDRYYSAVESTSIDYGLMQRTDRGVVLPASDWGWDDIGSWEALSRWLPVSAAGNVAYGPCIFEGCEEVIAYSGAGRVAVLGMRDCVVIRTDTDTLVVSRDVLGDLRSFVRSLGDNEAG